MKLREYQVRCVDSTCGKFKEFNSTLVVMATGCGKTVVFSSVIDRFQPKRAMVLAHREELIYQAQDKIHRTTGLECQIEMAHMRASDSLFSRSPVVVSTVQTHLSGGVGGERMRRFNPEDFGLLIIDEAHHAAADSYKRIIEYYRQNKNLKVLGVTATPDRADEEALGQVFESVAFDYEILDAINDGYLVPIDQQLITVQDLDFSAVRTTAGDLNGADLAAIMEQERNMQEVASASIQIIGNKRASVFTASVRQAETISNILNRHRMEMSDWVSGETPNVQRKQLLKRFSSGELQVLCNCAVLTEGYDNPAVEVVIQARPTKSRALYSQMIGRGTRPLPNVIDGLDDKEARCDAIATSPKPSLLVVDFVGNSGRHKLITSADILGGKVSEKAIEEAKEKAIREGKPVRMKELLEAKQRELEEEARKARIVAQATFSAVTVSPFDKYSVRDQKPNEWQKRNWAPLSEKQTKILKERLEINPEEHSISACRQLIGAYFEAQKTAPCSPKQANVLRRFGYNTSYTAKEASALIDRIAKAGWRRPPEEAVA